MVQIDKTDKLYNYLTKLGEENVDTVYQELAENGRFDLKDVKLYFNSIFETIDLNQDRELELCDILEFYKDIKKSKKLPKKDLNKALSTYFETKDEDLKTVIFNSYLEEVMSLAVFYYFAKSKSNTRTSTAEQELTIQDVLSNANLGLIEALEKYDPNNKIAFNDYLVYYVRKNILNLKEKEND